MTYVVAQRINPAIPVDLCAQVGAIIERELREQFPQASELERARDLRDVMRSMDPLTAIDILSDEGRVRAC